MKKFTGIAIGALCLIAVVVVCRYVEKQACEKRIQQVREELAPTPVPEVLPTEMSEVRIEVNSMSRPKIPFIKVPFGADPEDPSSTVRRVTFKTDTGEATVMVPVEARVIYPKLKQVRPGARETLFRVDQNGATLVITEQNEEEITVTYQILCDDGTTRYWAEGQSPPRMQIPPV